MTQQEVPSSISNVQGVCDCVRWGKKHYLIQYEQGVRLVDINYMVNLSYSPLTSENNIVLEVPGTYKVNKWIS